jgi:phosphatidylserine/phosphatidylglycerophosphate/cardiolipin synthase-like enzyme
MDSPQVGRALIDAKKRGVDVRLVTDNSNYNNKIVSEMQKSGIPVVEITGAL